MKRDIHQEVTDEIIAAIEAGTAPWLKEWDGNSGGMALPRRANGDAYQGINVLLLWIAAQSKGYTNDTWMTFKQAKELGGMVRKGEKGRGIVFYSTMKKEDKDTGEEKRFGFLKRYTVFNVEQIDGLPKRYTQTAPSVAGGEAPIAELDAFFAMTGAQIENGAALSPAYNPMRDVITMPTVQQFTTAHAYYGTLAHELIHWTAPEHRANRPHKYQDKEGRAMEELVAEIGACFLCRHIGAKQDMGNSASYVESWLRALKNDKRFIFRAASQAQQACDYALRKGRPQIAFAA